jgi:hypothetical protein
MSNDQPLSVSENLAIRQARRGGGRRGDNQGNPMWAIINVFPLILIPVLIYNIWAFGAGDSGVGAFVGELTNPKDPMTITMASGAEWAITTGDLFVLVAMVFLFIELLKSTSTGTAAIFNHALSMLVFIVCLVEFLLWNACATTPFFLITVMALLDVLAGVVVTIISARRDVEFAGQH